MGPNSMIDGDEIAESAAEFIKGNIIANWPPSGGCSVTFVFWVLLLPVFQSIKNIDNGNFVKLMVANKWPNACG